MQFVEGRQPPRLGGGARRAAARGFADRAVEGGPRVLRVVKLSSPIRLSTGDLNGLRALLTLLAR